VWDQIHHAAQMRVEPRVRRVDTPPAAQRRAHQRRPKHRLFVRRCWASIQSGVLLANCTPRQLAANVRCQCRRTKDVRETHKLVIAHIARIRRITNLQDSTIVLCLESNLAYEAQHIIHSLQEAGLRKWVALQEGAGQTLGWLTVRPR
jgi:hypothetical protein